ncbi:MAG TPA: DUF72 domain-containing protein [Actinomycetota bacterium]|nr:DUF72 domain-containing protein [Actinomycetota bacterium]
MAKKKREILVGTSSWTDKTLLATDWYPKDAKTAEARLAYYASRFPLVEVDSSYYALPSEKNAALWVERTPSHFTFNVKAFSLMTQHPAQVRALPKDLREAAGDKRTVYSRDLDPALIEQIFEMFRGALMPLHSAGKLGAILFQFPEWFTPAPENKDYVLEAASRLPDYHIAVEFRQRTWMDTEEHQRWTLDWLSENDLTYVGVDMPQGFPSSIPPVVAATSKELAVVRFHGHNDENWKKKGITVAERFDYLYSKKELKEWAPRLFDLAGETKRTHVLFNNCYQDKGVRNAADMASLLDDLI